MSARIALRTGRFTRINSTSRTIIRLASNAAETPAPAPSSTPSNAPRSSCPANTALSGLTWLKGQPPALALEDSEYPQWLWSVLDEKKPGDGTSKAERRQQNREKIRQQNFMKSQ